MKTLNLYQVYKWDGGDRHYPTHTYFENQVSAETWLKVNKYDHYVQVTLNIYESTFDYNMNEKQRKKQEALTKLTLEEQQLLGLI